MNHLFYLNYLISFILADLFLVGCLIAWTYGMILVNKQIENYRTWTKRENYIKEIWKLRNQMDSSWAKFNKVVDSQMPDSLSIKTNDIDAI